MSVDWLQETEGLVSTLVALVSGVLLLNKQVRGWVAFQVAGWRQRRSVPGLVVEMAAAIRGIQADVADVRAEVRLNSGGSVKDAILRMEQQMVNEFWLRPQPAFVCDAEGRNIRVTEAYCHLTGCRNMEELKSISWRLFVHPEDLAEYDKAWRTALKSGSTVMSKARFRSQYGLERGCWRIRIMPVGQIVSVQGEGSWHFTGYFTPADDDSRAVWEENGWST